MKLHKPEILKEEGGTSEWVTLALYLTPCPECNRPMVDVPEKYLHYCSSIVNSSQQGGNTIDAQCKRGGIVLRSEVVNKKDRKICVECAAAGKATFVCHQCKTERPANEIQTSFGDPPDYLCKPCYATLPAKEWDAATKSLSEMHRYDYD